MAGKGPGGAYVPSWGVAIVGSVLAAIGVFSTYSLVQFWPPGPAADQTTPPAVAQVVWLLWKGDIPRDTAYFVTVMSAGSLGAAVHALRSLSWYVGNRSMQQSWITRLVLQPVVGALLAVVVYLVFRAGLVSGPASTDAISPFGFAALAGLVGLFTDQAAVKLKAVFETLLTPAPQGDDKVRGPSIDTISPERGPVGTELRVRGSYLGRVTEVRFADLGATPTSVSDDEIVVKVPPGATSGVVTVVAPAQTAASPTAFDVTT